MNNTAAWQMVASAFDDLLVQIRQTAVDAIDNTPEEAQYALETIVGLIGDRYAKAVSG